MRHDFHNWPGVNALPSLKPVCYPLTLCLALFWAVPGCSEDGDGGPHQPETLQASRDDAKERPTLTFEAPPPRIVEVVDLTEAQKAALVGRVEEKWRAMERRDFAKVYEYTTPNYRKIFSKPMFLNRFAYDIRWQLTGVEILNYDAEAAVASVAVRVMSEPAKQTTPASDVGKISDTVKEKWFFIDGEWWNNAK